MKPQTISASLLTAALFLAASYVSAQKPALPTGTVPDGLGYNIHFTHAKPGEMEMIAGSGATIIRMDFHWGATEREKGVYDFSAYAHLTDSLEKHGLRPLYILDYGNRHFDGGLAPHSEEGRTAFANWAAAAALHFKDRGILWEMYNEPNIHFWKPKPDPEKYVLLALEVGRAIRQAAPNELYIGPATAQGPKGTIDYPFLEQCFKAGLLEYWDAVSVHPYRQKGPETVAEEYARLRKLIDRYAPPGKTIPILSAEWGYSSVWGNFDDDKQGKMLPRQWMTNLAFDVPISIWYDWHDDGKDPKEPEHHFGTVNFEYKKDQTPVYEPKPSYIAAKTFNKTFRGFHFNKRIWTGDDDVFVFLFSKGVKLNKRAPEVKLAIWTTAKETKEIRIPCPAGTFGVVSYLGEKQADATADKDGLKQTVSDGPVYLTPHPTPESSPFWENLAKLESRPLAVCDDVVRPILPHATFSGRKKMAPVKAPGGLSRFVAAGTATFEQSVEGIEIVQRTDMFNPAPINIRPPVLIGKKLIATINNPLGVPFEGEYRIENIGGFEMENATQKTAIQKIVTRNGETETTIRFPIKNPPENDYAFSAKIIDTKTSGTLELPRRTMRKFADFGKLDSAGLNAAWALVPDGDAKVGSEQKIEIADGRIKLTYKFDDGWKFVRIFPKAENARVIDDKPAMLFLRAQGDGTPTSINFRFRDSRGQFFQVHGGHLKDDSVHNLFFKMDGIDTLHWGGPNDGTVHYPIQFDSIIADGTRKACGPSTLFLSFPVLIYE